MRWATSLAIAIASLPAPAPATRQPAHRFAESSCAATLALSASDPKLYGAEAYARAANVPRGRISFRRAQQNRLMFVQTSILTGDAVAERLRAIRAETKRLDAEVAASRSQRDGESWRTRTYLAWTAASGLWMTSGLALGPQSSWIGAGASLVGFAAAATWVGEAVKKRRYLSAVRTPESVEFLDLDEMRAQLEDGGKFDHYTTFDAALDFDLIAACRIDGEVPVECLVDAVDANVLWKGDIHHFRPAMHVIVHMKLDGNAKDGPILTTVVFFLAAQPQPEYR